jgi:hypothetical protein
VKRKGEELRNGTSGTLGVVESIIARSRLGAKLLSIADEEFPVNGQENDPRSSIRLVWSVLMNSSMIRLGRLSAALLIALAVSLAAGCQGPAPRSEACMTAIQPTPVHTESAVASAANDR